MRGSTLPFGGGWLMEPDLALALDLDRPYVFVPENKSENK